MTDAPGWPDEARPGVPLNPERDGAHFVGGEQMWWSAAYQGWLKSPDVCVAYMAEQAAELGWNYYGPCLTPTEHSAALAAHAVAMREACCALVEFHPRMPPLVRDHCGRLDDEMRALPIPHEPALAALLVAERAAGVREGMEGALIEVSKLTQDGPVRDGERPARDAWNGVVEVAMAAITAAMKETKT